jgi:hypothetical protein
VPAQHPGAGKELSIVELKQACNTRVKELESLANNLACAMANAQTEDDAAKTGAITRAL